MSRIPYGLFALVVGIYACSGASHSPEAIRQAVIDHLSKRSDMVLSAMDIEVASVAFRKDEADAVVSFRPKGSSTGGGMQMSYTLERKGNSWTVRGKKESGSPHSSGTPRDEAGFPPGHPPMTRGSDASPKGQAPK